MEGLHILAEFKGCRCASHLLLEAEALQQLCLAACQQAGLTVVGQLFHPFGTPEVPAGATGAVVLAESHLAIHTWPELGAVTLDLYVCNFSRDNQGAAEAAYTTLLQAFRPETVGRRDVLRGSLEA